MTNLRYIRQIDIIGQKEQQQLTNTRILCVGAGGLGSLVSTFLVTAGVKQIGLVDNDKIEISNLTRQLSYTENDCGQSKVHVLGDYLQKRDSNCRISIHDCRLQSDNAEQIIVEYDVIVDCTDNFASKYLISDICNLSNKPLISASIDGFNGQVLTLLPNICYRCVFPQLSNGSSCTNGNVIGPAVGIVASAQANEVIKLIIGFNTENQLVQIDSLNNLTHSFKIHPDPTCINSHDNAMQTQYKSCINYLPWNEALNLKRKNELIIVDIRTNKRQPLEISTIESNYENILKLDLAKNKNILIVCNYGEKSKLAALRLVIAGYQNVFYTSLVSKFLS